MDCRRDYCGLAGANGDSGCRAVGLLGDLVIGVAGAMVGGWFFGYFGHPGATGVNLGSLVVAFVGAVVLLWLVRQVLGARGTRWA